MLRTESPSDDHTDLDLYATPDLLLALIDDQQRAAQAVRAVAGLLAQALDAALPRMAAGGRLIYVGAGTSGRLGLLDSVELGPTFNWPADRALAMLAGGRQAVFEAAEGAEDDAEQGAVDLRLAQVTASDVVLLVAASGHTPYVLGALQAAREVDALTISLVCNPDTPLARDAHFGVVLDTGPECISGSTRLKAGTAQKIALNSFSTALMVRLHKVYGHLMVDLRATNAKLRRRALALTQHATGADELTAERALHDSGFQVKVAIVMLKTRRSAADATAALGACQGSVRAALTAHAND